MTTYFIARDTELQRAYQTYVEVAEKAAQHSEIEVTLVSPEPLQEDLGRIKDDLVKQFRIEQPNEEFTNLKLYSCTAIVTASESIFDQLGSHFLMDEESAVADEYPSYVSATTLKPLANEMQ